MMKEIISLSGMMKFFKEDINRITKGESKYKADFVLNLRVPDLVIVSKIIAFMKNKSYSVKLASDGDADNPIPTPISFKEIEGRILTGHQGFSYVGVDARGSSNLKYIELTGNKVESAGLFLVPCGYLGCSPDGIIYEEKEDASNHKGILEIKCPWKHWNSTINEMIEAELKGKNEIKSFYLTAEKELNKSQPY